MQMFTVHGSMLFSFGFLVDIELMHTCVWMAFEGVFVVARIEERLQNLVLKSSQ